MELKRLKIEQADSQEKKMLKGLYNKRAKEYEKLSNELKSDCIDSDTAAAVKRSLYNIEHEAESIKAALDDDSIIDPDLQRRAKNAPSGSLRTLHSAHEHIFNGKENRQMEDNNIELRSLQRFLTVGYSRLTATEQRALDTSGGGAVIPKTVFNELITSEKWSDLLQRASQFHDQNAGKLSIPIASHNDAEWHIENAAGNEKNSELTQIELGGYELMRLMSMSAAMDSMTAVSFKDAMLQVLSSELVEALEYAFINGSGSGQPKGLVNLTWSDANTVKATEITFKDIAKGLSLLPQKYARNSILLMNANVAYNTLAAAADTNGMPIFNIESAAQSVLGHEIVISEHMPADTIFIVDPKELYVRFSMSPTVEADKSSGFKSATIDLRALCVVDAAWNPAACIKIEKDAA